MTIIQLHKRSQNIWKACVYCMWFILQEPINDNFFEYLRYQTSKKRHRQTLIFVLWWSKFQRNTKKKNCWILRWSLSRATCNQRKALREIVIFLKGSFGSITSSYRSTLRGCQTNLPFFTNTHYGQSLLSFEN